VFAPLATLLGEDAPVLARELLAKTPEEFSLACESRQSSPRRCGRLVAVSQLRAIVDAT
jgi:hypothetical protein